ncbi:MAG: hypothetical protein QX189_03760 [Methylococcales bacterium]
MQTLDFTVEWDGKETESLIELLEKKQQHIMPQAGALNSHLIATRKSTSIAEVIALWSGYPQFPENIRNNPVFLTVLALTSLALISPRSLKIVPDSAAEILKVFETKGFYRFINKKKLIEAVGDEQVVEDGLMFLLARRLIEADGEKFRLLEVPLTNVKIGF